MVSLVMIELMQLSVMVVGIALSFLIKKPVRCVVVGQDVVVSSMSFKGGLCYAKKQDEQREVPSGL